MSSKVHFFFFPSHPPILNLSKFTYPANYPSKYSPSNNLGIPNITTRAFVIGHRMANGPEYLRTMYTGLSIQSFLDILTTVLQRVFNPYKPPLEILDAHFADELDIYRMENASNEPTTQ